VYFFIPMFGILNSDYFPTAYTALDAHCVLCEVRTESLSEMYTDVAGLSERRPGFVPGSVCDLVLAPVYINVYSHTFYNILNCGFLMMAQNGNMSGHVLPNKCLSWNLINCEVEHTDHEYIKIVNLC
jgi:hypothetical protein